MTLGRRQYYAYSKVDKEDPEEVSHRRAQFLIYKALKQADCRRKQSLLKIKMCRLKVKIGKRLRKLRKSMAVSIYAARIEFYKQIIMQLKALKRFFAQGKNIATLPPLLK